jgi:hypothetical protein
MGNAAATSDEIIHCARSLISSGGTASSLRPVVDGRPDLYYHITTSCTIAYQLDVGV